MLANLQEVADVLLFDWLASLDHTAVPRHNQSRGTHTCPQLLEQAMSELRSSLPCICGQTERRPLGPERGWRIRYTLRGMCVFVAFVAVCMAVEANWIWHRRLFVGDEEASHKIAGLPLAAHAEFHTAPGLLWLFGEKGYFVVDVLVEGTNLQSLTVGDRQRIERNSAVSGIIH